jgi:lipid-A-disaccharide synthase
MTIYFVAGEVSADNHGAALMRALQQLDAGLKFAGRGGPQMKSVAGEGFKDWIEEAGVLGLWEVVKHYGYFRKQFQETLHEIEEVKPEAVVLIDYPGFNLRLARALRRQASARKLIYYISPQVWAWNRGRIRKMARWLDLMLCIFPFEADLYNKSGLRTIFVGHPMIERLHARRIDVQRDPNLIGLFPGSRRREVRKIFPLLLETAGKLQKEDAKLRFEVAAASDEIAHKLETMWHRHLSRHRSPRRPKAVPADELGDSKPDISLQIKTGETTALMQRAIVGVVASGSATLEAAYFRLPFVLVYKVAWITYLAGRLVVKVDYLGMPNVLANREVVPEFIQHRAKPPRLATALRRLLHDPAARSAMVSDFDAIIDKLGGIGASEKAAQAIIEALRA